MRFKRKRKHDHQENHLNRMYQDANRELRRWGIFHARVFKSEPRCTLSEMVQYGIRVGAVHYDAVSNYYPDILQTQRVWSFMPDPAQKVVYLQYCYDGSKTRKALLLGMNRDKFNYHLAKGLEFYTKYRDTDFAAIGWG